MTFMISAPSGTTILALFIKEVSVA
jgi:hypothetical protein